jgi:hypothetical protein
MKASPSPPSRRRLSAVAARLPPKAGDGSRDTPPPSAFHHSSPGGAAARSARDFGAAVRKRSTRSRMEVRVEADDARPSDIVGEAIVDEAVDENYEIDVKSTSSSSSSNGIIRPKENE